MPQRPLSPGTAPPAWLTTAQAAGRLGVKPDTLYAYVSRGLLHPHRAPDGRTSRFDPAEVERLAARGRRAAPSTPSGPVIASGLTAIEHGRLFYRGMPADELARARSFEEVAEWLWSGSFPAARGDWQADPAALALARAVQAVLPDGTHPLDRLRVIAAAAPARDPLDSVARRAPSPEVARVAGRTLLATLVDGLPDLPPRPPLRSAGTPQMARKGRGSTAPDRAAVLPSRSPSDEVLRPQPGSTGHDRALEAPSPSIGGRGRGWGPAGPGAVALPHSVTAGSLAQRLWVRLTPEPATPVLLRALDAALVLMADHELTASTLAARAAASVHTDLYGVVLAGLAVAGGAWHGGVGRAVQRFVAGVERPEGTRTALDERARRGGPVPGFGQPLYPDGDIRAAVMLELLRATAPPRERMALVEALLEAARAAGLPPPNADFALAALAHIAGMIPGAGETIFAIARVAGWIAHALEEYGRAAPLRPRAAYTGPPPR